MLKQFLNDLGTGSDAKMKFDHVTITVANMQRSVEFYRDLLGLKVLGKLENKEESSLFVYLDTGNGVLELFEFQKEGRPVEASPNEDHGLKHIGFRVDSVDEVISRLRERDVKITLEPLDANGGVRIAFFEDPDGVLLEVIEGDLQLDPYRDHGH